jgi:hypothetical protein
MPLHVRLASENENLQRLSLHPGNRGAQAEDTESNAWKIRCRVDTQTQGAKTRWTDIFKAIRTNALPDVFCKPYHYANVLNKLSGCLN